MSLHEFHRNAEVVERVRYTVGEAADDEERDCKEERQIMLLSCERDSRRHEEAAAYAEETAVQSAGLESEFKNLLSGSLDVHRRDTGEESEHEAAQDVSQKDQEECAYFILLYESGCACVEFQFVAHNRQKSQREEYCTGKGAILSLKTGSQKAETGSAYEDARKYRRAECIYHIIEQFFQKAAKIHYFP